jgi:hypothetical protein
VEWLDDDYVKLSSPKYFVAVPGDAGNRRAVRRNSLLFGPVSAQREADKNGHNYRHKGDSKGCFIRTPRVEALQVNGIEPGINPFCTRPW